MLGVLNFRFPRIGTSSFSANNHPAQTIIHSDLWKSYAGNTTLPVHPPYQHMTMDHTKNFLDPCSVACTNQVECFKKNCKQYFKAIGGVHTSTLESHLDEFLWQQFHGKDAISAFDAML